MKLWMRPLVLLFATFFLLGNVVACFDDDDDDGGLVIQPFTITLPINSINVQGIVGTEFEFTDLTPVDARFSGPTLMSFPTASTMRIESGGTVVEGPVTFGNGTCTLQSLPTMDRCDMTINSPNPIPANSRIPGQLVRRSAPGPNLAVVGGGLFPAFAAVQTPTGSATIAPNMGVGGQDRSATPAPFDLSSGDCPIVSGDPSRGMVMGIALRPAAMQSFGDGQTCIHVDGRPTTAQVTGSGGVTGGGGIGG